MSNETQIAKRDEAAMEQLREGNYIRPPVDIFENTDEILLYADLPGVTSEDLTLHLEGGELSIQGTRKLKAPGPEGEAKELIYHRTFKIPTSVDDSKIDASLKLGVLELHLPKRESFKPRQINVRVD